MPTPTPAQRRRIERLETVIGVVAPALDLVLAAADRVSRLVDRGPDDYVPPRAPLAPTPRR